MQVVRPVVKILHLVISKSTSASLEVLIPRAPVTAVSSDNQNNENGTPREEFQSLFRRAGSSFHQNPDLPQFQRRNLEVGESHTELAVAIKVGTRLKKQHFPRKLCFFVVQAIPLSEEELKLNFSVWDMF